MSFAPDSLRAKSSRIGTYGVLGIGIASAIALILVAWGPLVQPEKFGLRRFQELKAEAEDGIRRRWTRSNSTRDISRVALGLEWDRFDLPPESWQPALSPLSNEVGSWLEQRTNRAPNFDLLLAESERHEFQTGDLERALTACRDALRIRSDPVRTAEAQLRLLQLSLKAEQVDQAQAPWKWMVENLYGHESLDGYSILGIGYLALGSSEVEFPAELLAATHEKLSAAITESRLHFPDPNIHVIDEGEERVSIQVGQSFQELTKLFEQHRLTTPELNALFREFFQHRVLVARFHLSEIQKIPIGVSLHRGEDYTTCSFLQQGSDTLSLALVPTASLPARLKDYLASDISLEHGFEIQVGTSSDVDSETLTQSLALPNTDYRITVKHPNPSSLVRQAAIPIQFLRWGLSVLGLLTLVTAVAIHRAVLRQQRLQQMKTDFVANVSHELRTPISSILLMAENLENQLVTDRKNVDRYHRLIRREAVRLRRLIADILDFSRLNRGKLPAIQLTPVKLVQWQQDLTAEFRQWSKDHQVQLRVEGELPAIPVMLDPEALRRAAFNLADNARRHSGKAEVDLIFAASPDTATIRIRDFGIGLTKGSEKKIFEPFYQDLSDSIKGKGAGLGLAIVAQIARSHGGEASAANADGGGAIFSLTIPISPTQHDS
ncbi:MAG: HAMP domain-containing histidine kinase [Planctomycetes bacterium]|nr:HAMP domain-containing histidine kinase [Planctomycetota bacterium]